MDDRTVRRARLADRETIAAFTEDTWTDREFRDYVPEAFPEWVEADDPDRRTVVAEVGGEPVGLLQASLLTDDEAWLQGIRVHPDHRGAGHGLAMTASLCDWCRERGATVARNMVFDWNGAGMGQSRAAGFSPGPACRWLRPEPTEGDEGTEGSSELDVREDGAAAWRYWTHSDARSTLDGLALDDEETWAVAELTRDRFDGLAESGRAIAVAGDRTRAMTVRIGTRDSDGETVVDYAVAAWSDPDAAGVLFDAIREDAAACDGDETRVLIPETTRYVSDAALRRVSPGDGSVYVFAADLTGQKRDS